MKKIPPQDEKPEFSRIIKFNEWLDNQSHMHFQLEENEKKKLEHRLDVQDIHYFKLDLQIQRIEENLIDFDIKGTVSAEWKNHKNEIFSIQDNFNTKILHSSLSVSYDEFIEDIEYTDDGIVDIGEIATQYLIIMIDEKYSDLQNTHLTQEPELEPKHNPFSVLKNLTDDHTN